MISRQNYTYTRTRRFCRIGGYHVNFFLIIAFCTSIAGAVCGMGGGIILKPVLDAVTNMNIAAINFLSGCTVLSMACVTLIKNNRNKNQDCIPDIRTGTPLAIGAALGGIAGKALFKSLCEALAAERTVGAIQAGVLLLITAGTLFFSYKRKSISNLRVSNPAAIFLTGILLGIFSSFLGIGGGPVNIVVLTYFFSMNVKQTVANSLYIILFSQLASLLYSLALGEVPEVNKLYLLLMVIGGIFGGSLGSRINRRIPEHYVEFLFRGILLLIILINIFNLYKYSHL